MNVSLPCSYLLCQLTTSTRCSKSNRAETWHDDIWLSKWRRVILHLISGDSAAVFGTREDAENNRRIAVTYRTELWLLLIDTKHEILCKNKTTHSGNIHRRGVLANTVEDRSQEHASFNGWARTSSESGTAVKIWAQTQRQTSQLRRILSDFQGI